MTAKKRTKTSNATSSTTSPFEVLATSTDMDFTAQDQLDAEALIQACYDDEVDKVKVLVQEKRANAWVQDRQGWTALHAAAASGNADMCTFLLRQSNAVWNIVDQLGCTAGDIAFSLNHSEAYSVLLSEGVRAEMLRSAMQPFAPSPSSSPSDDDDDNDKDNDDDKGPAPIVAEEPLSTASDNATFLASRLTFTRDSSGQEIALDAEGNGVMMGWEEPIMKRTAKWLCEPIEHRFSPPQPAAEGEKASEGEDEEEEELVVVNVGFGLGIIDTYLQSYRPTTHLIIEPHPDVLAFAESRGWFSLPGVRFFKGTWQAYLLAQQDGTEPYLAFDAIYFDTYSEHYSDLHRFFDVLPDWLRSEQSRFSFFHGLGATSRNFYDVYTEVSELHLREIGLETEWEEVEVGPRAMGVWDGTAEGKKYWGDVGPYRMPKCRLVGMI